MAVLVRSVNRSNDLALDEEVSAGPRDIDSAMQQWLSVFGVRRHERAASRQNRRERTRRFFRDMECNGDGRVEPGWETAHELHERVHPAGRRTHDNDVALTHVSRHRQKSPTPNDLCLK